MNVYKFGGASIRTADGVRNLREIVQGEEELFVVVSAMGKTTNALEAVFEAVGRGDRAAAEASVAGIRAFHTALIADLFGRPQSLLCVEELLASLEETARTATWPLSEAERAYDAVVSYGELLSSCIVAAYLETHGVACRWLDMRELIGTDDRHKEATVDLSVSTERLQRAVGDSSERLFIAQGFVGSAPDGSTTTLGREGSDYTAAVAAYALGAESLSVWKDVDGLLNADPRLFPEAQPIPVMSYLDAIELAYSGASIIHPRTLKPLQAKNIPLYVRPFGDRRKPGSVIRSTPRRLDIPILVVKHDQVLVTVRSRDLSFIIEERFAAIFSLLDRHRIRTNLVHCTAVNLSLAIDRSWRLDEAVAELRAEGYDVLCTFDLELLTIRDYDQALLDRYATGRDIFVVQRTQATARIVRRKASPTGR